MNSASIPSVLPVRAAFPYALEMGVKPRTALDWGARFMHLLKARPVPPSSLAHLAPLMNLSEGALRHWTNGTRQVTLEQFLQLCAAAKIDPGLVLFTGLVDDKFLAIGEAWKQGDDLEREVLWTAAQGILSKRGATSQQGSTLTVPRRAGARPRG